MTQRRLLRAGVLALAALLVVVVALFVVRPLLTQRQPGPRAMNAIVIIVDDESDFTCARMPAFMPKTARWLLSQGTCFQNAVSPDPVCCPARAQIQTGQLPHNNRVTRQIDARKIDVTHTVQYALGQAGLDTYGVGKNLNGIDPSTYYGPHAQPNGFQSFDFWKSYKSFGYQLYDDQGRAHIPPGPRINTTVRTGDLLHTFVQGEVDRGHPFFAYAAFFAPHKQNYKNKGGTSKDFPLSTPANAHREAPAFHFAPERNAADKLHYFRKTRHGERYYRGLYIHRVRAMYDVDDQLSRLHDQLSKDGILDNTAVIFVSDNGYTDRGQDNWDGKSIPYPAATQVPMLAYLPGTFAAGQVVNGFAGLSDIMPTLLQLFALQPNHVLDGHSLLDPAALPDSWYGEYRREDNALVTSESGLGTSRLLSWRSYTHLGDTYVEWYHPDGSVRRAEFYRDPGMTRNLLYPPYHQAPPPSTIARYKQWLDRAAQCAGTVEQGSADPCP